jgi:hypothetical protein
MLCERRLENPYYRLLCCEEFFCHKLPFDRSSMHHPVAGSLPGAKVTFHELTAAVRSVGGLTIGP